MERQQVGRNTWKKIGEIPGVPSYRDTGVERGRKYCYRIRAVTAEGTSEVMETDEMQAGTLGKQSWPIHQAQSHRNNRMQTAYIDFYFGIHLTSTEKEAFHYEMTNRRPCTLWLLTVTSFQKGLKICQSKFQVTDIQLKAKCDLPINLLVRYLQCRCDDGT